MNYYKIYSYSVGLKTSQVATVLLWIELNNGVVHCSEEHVSWEVFHTALLFRHSTCPCLQWIERFSNCCLYCLSIQCALHVSAVIQVCPTVRPGCQTGHEYSKISHTTAIQKCSRSLAQDTARCICLTEYRRDAILDSTGLTCSFHLRSLDQRAPTSLNVCTQLIVLVSSGSFRIGPIIVSILQPLTFIHASCDCSIRAGYIQLVADLATLSDCSVLLSTNLCAVHEVCRSCQSCPVHLSHFGHSTDALLISIVTMHAQKNCQTARLKWQFTNVLTFQFKWKAAPSLIIIIIDGIGTQPFQLAFIFLFLTPGIFTTWGIKKIIIVVVIII